LAKTLKGLSLLRRCASQVAPKGIDALPIFEPREQAAVFKMRVLYEVADELGRARIERPPGAAGSLRWAEIIGDFLETSQQLLAAGSAAGADRGAPHEVLREQ
jgi:hypothetical protein